VFVERLRITDFRCFTRVDIAPVCGINVIVGPNASGKSSLLEALFFLGRGRSFRPSATREAIRGGCHRFTLVADIAAEEKRRHRLAVQGTRTQTQYRYDSTRETTRLDLIATLPLQIIDPNVHRLLEQGPRYRRHFMDWGVFHVEHAFFPAWRRYRRALKQRNQALRQRWAKKDIITWDAELVHQAEIIDASRRTYIDALDTGLSVKIRGLLGEQSIRLTYNPGWSGSEGFGAALAANLQRDVHAGFTQQGPHRADLKVTIARVSARDWVSRGQQKLLTTALLLAQAQILQTRRGVRPVLLIDDLPAELGDHYREALGQEIQALGGQSFLTFLDAGLIPRTMAQARMFHVEQHTVA
jgi:DNA replication and repair protein RecF